jgi:hypothetical protein
MTTDKIDKNISLLVELIWLSLLMILCVPAAYSQDKNSFLESVTDKFNRYCSAIPREEVYIHTDRDVYISGEELWFEAYLNDRKNPGSSQRSNILYFEILNSENRPVVQKHIRLENGFGPGQVSLPDTLSTGIYSLRAYTNWMKNFLPYNCFIKKLNIYNALKTQGARAFLNQKTIPARALNSGTAGNLSGTGFNVEVKKLNSGNASITISSTRDFRSGSKSTCYLFVQTHGIINFKQAVDLAGDTIRIDVPGSRLIPGINHFTVFNAAGNPIAERYIYTPYYKTQTLAVSSPDSCKTRGKIALVIESIKEQGREVVPSKLSISVAPATEKTFPDLADYMIFGSEFGTLPDEILKSDLDNLPNNILDHFLSGVKSNWIDWNTILSGRFPELNYNKETENHYLYGRLINKSTTEPEKDRYLFLSTPSKHASFQYAKTDAKGNFTFTIPIDDRPMDLIIQPEDINRNNNIKLETSFSITYPELIPFRDTSVFELPRQISKLGTNYQVKKIYGSDEPLDNSKPLLLAGGTKRFYGKPDIELVMSDYIKLPVMQEVFFELIPGVFLKKKKSDYEISISDPVENKIYDRPPVLFVDGVVINDPAVIANLDPELVEKIDVIKSRYFVGDYLFFGLVNVITKAGDFSNFSLPDYAVRLLYRVTDPVKTFSSPDYSDPQMKKSRVPDFRNTLYWNPSMQTDKNGNARIEFWSSDFVTDYEINIQGMTENGQPISVKKRLKVQ